MNAFPSEFERAARSVAEIYELLDSLGAELALLKVLPKNANDKNQIYIAADFGVLYDLFDLTLTERGVSMSESKGRTEPGARIPEASFNSFSWLKRDGSLVEAKRVKAIIYPQYPEARLSGLQTVENTMPQALSVAYTKANPAARRLLVLARLPRGQCIGIVYLHLSPALEEGLAQLPGFERARACKKLIVEQGSSAKLEARLAKVLGVSLRGCRLDSYGKSLPFSGTQVCGYTLEHALGIIPNSGMDGDLYGIELKTHTQVKVTLFTPEPDGGHYVRDFRGFMNKYGYRDSDGDYRLTGIHRANVLCVKSGLTLRLREQQLVGGAPTWLAYDPDTPLTAKIDAVEVALIGVDGEVAASWSLARLMNCWGAKHNEAVYIHANKILNPNLAEAVEGYEHLITFEKTVMWCRETSAEKLIAAIGDGTIFLDPAPKLHASDPSKNKRRSQWRVNDITKAAKTLYSSVNFKTIETVSSDGEIGVERTRGIEVTPHQHDLFVVTD
jgi:hypothetical protein